MSRTIDERVVSMQFDNKHFENNVQTTLGTLDKLKKSLKLDGASKGLQNVGAAAKKCDLSPIGDSAQKVGLKFNALYAMADETFRDMFRSAKAYAKKIVSAFTTDPIKAGFSEYELKMGSVQTIMAGTGESLETVNKYLEELNQYSDQTIYSFADMTSNIGKFTNAGVKLEDAVAAIKGISNVAALSGANANEASRAMYNFSQALSAGYVKLIDWKSIENANMATVGFKEQLIEMALEMGTIEKASDGMYKTLEGNTFNATKNFNEVFQDQWLTSEVLVKTLEQYADETTDIGAKATAAATEVKTFTMMMDTLKESAQSGWAQTWELIIGDFDEAKELWTNVSNVLGDIIGDSSKKRNDLLKGALESNWDRMVAKIEEAGVSADDFEKQLRDTMTKAGIPVDNFLKRFGSFENMLKEGVVDASLLTDALTALKKEGNPIFQGIDKITKGMTKDATGEGVKQLQAALTALGYELPKYGIDGIFQEETKATLEAFQKASGLKVTGIVDQETLDMLAKATKGMDNLNFEVDELAKGALELSGRELLLKSFANIFKAIQKPMQAVGKAWSQVIGSMSSETLFKGIVAFEQFTQKLIMSPKSLEKVTRGFAGLFSIVKVLGKVVGGGLKLAFTLVNKVLDNFDMNLLDVFGYVGDLLVRFEQWIAKNDYIAKGVQWLADKIAAGAKAVKSWFDEFIRLPKVQKYLDKFKSAWSSFIKTPGEYIGKAWTALKNFFSTIYESERVQALLSKFKGGFVNTFENIKERLSGLIDAFKNFFKNLRSGTSFKDAFASFKDSVVDYFSNIDYKAVAKNILSKIGTFIKNLVANIVSIGKSVFGAIGTFLKNAWGAFEGIGKFIKENIGSIVALASIVMVLSTLRKIKMAMELIVSPLETLQETLQGLTQAAKGIATAAKRSATAALVKNLGISIGIIAASIAVLAQIPRDKLINAVIAVGAIAAILGVLAFTMSKAIKNLDTKDTAVLSAYLLSIGGAMIMMALTAKIMGGMDWDEWVRGLGAVGAFVAMMVVIAKTSQKSEVDISRFGTMVLKLSASLIILAIAMKMFAKMDGDVILKGGGVIVAFLGVITLMMKSTSKVGSEADKFGKMMLGIGAALVLMAFAIKILGKMDTKELIQGGIAVGVLMFIVGLMTKMSKIGAGEKSGAYAFGKMMSSIGTALILMSGAVLILGKMDVKELIQGGIAVGVLMGIIAAMMAATKLLGKNTKDLGKLGTMMMGFGAALLLISGSILLLGMMDKRKLEQGLEAVTVIGLLFTALIAVSKGIKGLKIGPLMAISVALLLVVGSVVALSFIDKDKLIRATACMSILMLSLAAIMKSASSMKKLKTSSLIGILAAAALVAGLAYLMKLLTDKIEDPDGALKIAVGLSALMLAIAGTLYVMSKVSNAAKGASAGGIGKAVVLLGAVAIAVGGLAALAIWQMPNIAKQFSAFMEELQPFVTGASNIDQDTLTAIKTLAEIMSVMGGASIKFGISKLFGVDALTEFKNFIVEAVPVVKQMAVEISNDKINIDTKKVSAIVDIVKNLAEAAGNIPSFVAGGGLGFGKGFFGAAGGVMIPQLEEFKEFIVGVIPVVKDMAMAVSAKGVSINASAVNAIVGAVGTLSEAAANAPSIEVDAGGGGAKGKMVAYASVSIPMLGKFKDFIINVAPAIGGLGQDLSGVTVNSEAVSSICQGVADIITATESLPGSIKAGGGFLKAGSVIAIAGGVEIPQLKKMTEFFKTVLAEFKTFASDLGTESCPIDQTKADILKTICDAVAILCTACRDLPNSWHMGGIGVGIGRLQAGGFIGVGGAEATGFTDFEAIKGFFTGAVKALSDWVIETPDENIKKLASKDSGKALETICKGIKTLCEAAGYIEENVNVEGMAGGLGIAKSMSGFGFGGGFLKGSIKIDKDFDAITGWFNSAYSVVSSFVVPANGGNIKEADLSTFEAICDGIKTLALASSYIPTEKNMSAGGGFGGAAFIAKWIPALFGGGGSGEYIQTPMLDKAITWFSDAYKSVNNALLDGIDDNKKVEEADLKIFTGICSGVETLASAASKIPSMENTETNSWAVVAGFFKSHTTSSVIPLLDETAKWFGDVGKAAVDVITYMKTGNDPNGTNPKIDGDKVGFPITEADLEMFNNLCTSIDVISGAANKVPKHTKKSTKIAGGLVTSIDETKPMLEETGKWFDSMSKGIIDLIDKIKKDENGGAGVTDEDIKKLNDIVTVIDSISAAASNVPEKTSETVVTLAGFGTKVSGADFDGLIKWLSGDEQGNNSIVSALSVVKTQLEEMKFSEVDAQKFTSLGTSLTSLCTAADNLPQMTDYEGVFSELLEVTEFEQFTDWISGVGAALATLDTDTEDIKAGHLLNVAKVVETLTSAVRNLFTAAGATGYIFGGMTGTIIAEDLSAQLTDFSVVLEKIRDMADEYKNIDDMNMLASTMDSVTLALKRIKEMGTISLEAEIAAFETNTDDLKDAINLFAGSIVTDESLTNAIKAVNSVVAMLDSIEGIEYAGLTSLTSNLSGLYNKNVTDFIDFYKNNSVDTAVAEVAKLASAMGGLSELNFGGANSLNSALTKLGESGVSDFVNTFKEASGEKGSVITAVEGLVTAAKNAAGSETMIAKFVGVGENISSGLATGISNKSSSVTSAAKQVAVDAYNAAMKELEINSPSKKFMRLGYGIDEGFVKGIDGMSYMVTRSAVNVADTAIEGTKSVISRLASAIDSDIDTQPTIRPVLDLSDVSSGASTINGMFGMSPSIRTLSNVGYLSASVTNRQNGSNSDVISAIEKLGSKLGQSGPTYQFGDISYDNDSALNNAVGQLVRAVRVERRK